MPYSSFQGTPEWYGGMIKNLGDRAHQVTTVPYQKYQGDRLAKFNPLQEQSFDMGQKGVNNPLYSQLFDRSSSAIMNAMGQDITSQISPYIQNSVQDPTVNAQQYMNPYNDQVIQNIGKLASRNLTENILPNVNDQFIRSGSYGSSGGPGSRSHQDLTGRAIRDTQEGVARAQGEALQSGYNKAMDTSIGQQERNLQAGKLSGSVAAEDAQRQIVGGRELENLSAQNQGEMRQNTNFLGQLGSQQQQQEQQGLNKAYADFQEEKNYPYIQAARESELVRGLQPGQWTSQTNSYVPQLPQASPWSQGAGLVAGTIGALNQRPQGFSEGGEVRENKGKSHNSVAHLRHYADGGSVDLTPIQRGVNDALDTSEIRAMRSQANKLEQMQVDPFWSAVTRTGFNMASKRTPGVLANLGESMNEGMNEYQSQLTNQTNREVASANLRSMIDNTLRLQEERNKTHAFNKEKFEHDKSYDISKLGIEREKLGVDKQLARIKLGELTGEFGESKEEKAAYKKSDQEGLEDSRLVIHTSDKIIDTINKLKALNEKLNTGTGGGAAYEKFGAAGAKLIGVAGKGEKKDIDLFNSLSRKLALLQEGAAKSNKGGMARLAMIASTKPTLSDNKESNEENLDGMLKEIISERDKAKDIVDNLKLSGKNKYHAVDLEKKRDDWVQSGRKGSFKDFLEGNTATTENNPESELPGKPEESDSLKKDWIKKAGSIDGKLTDENGKEWSFEEFSQARKKSKGTA